MIVLVPAYGRVYKTIYELVKDWEDGKDFKIYGGPYCSIRDEEQLLEEWLQISIYNPITNEYYNVVPSEEEY